MKAWRKATWARGRIQLPIRIGELMQAGIDLKKIYLYQVKVAGPNELQIILKKIKEVKDKREWRRVKILPHPWSRGQLPIRVNELTQAKIDFGRKYLYSVEVLGPEVFKVLLKKAVNR